MSIPEKEGIPLSSFASFGVPRQHSNLDLPPIELVSTCECKKITSIFSGFDSEKASIVRSIGFDGLLKLPMHEKLNDELTLWLYKRIDFENMTLKLDGGVELLMTEVDVFLILGIPFEGQSVQFGMSHSKDEVTAFKNKLFSGRDSSSLTLSYLECILKKDYGPGCSVAQKDALKIAIVLYSLCYFLAPEPNHDFPAHLLSNFLTEVKPEEINWAHYVLLTLSRAAQHVQCQLYAETKKIVLFGCALLIQVFYLDNLNFGPSTPYHIILPRAKVYLPHTISEFIESDSTGASDDKLMQFGKAEVRAVFDVCYSRGWHYHINVHSNQELTVQNNFLSSIEIVSQSLQVLHQFAAQLNQLNLCNDTSAQDSLVPRQLSSVIIRSKVKESIDELSTKAAGLLKSSIINLYKRHIPVTDVVESDSRKRKRNGTCDPSSSRTSNAPGQNGHPQNFNSTVNSIVFQKKTVTSHSNFPISTFDLISNHSDVPTYKKLRTYHWLTGASLTRDELDRQWIVFSDPTPLSISGHVVQHCLKLNGLFTVSIVDAIMVLWNYLDDVLHSNFQRHGVVHKRWRHFFPASFVETVLDHGDYLNSDAIRSCFIGDQIRYSIEDCQKMVMPVFLVGSWSCYFWDLKLKTITVLDPMLMNTPAAKANQKHRAIVSQLHKAFLACKNNFFSGWDIEESGWCGFYRTDLDFNHNFRNTGLYAVHYARAYSGENIAFPLKGPNEYNLSPARGEILYQLFCCAENKGYRPGDLMQLVGELF